MTHCKDGKQSEWDPTELEHVNEACAAGVLDENLVTSDESTERVALLGHTILENICVQPGPTEMSYFSSCKDWAEVPLNRPTSVFQNRSKLETTLEYVYLSNSQQCKPVKNKRKQKIVLREDDHIEFIESFPSKRAENCRLPLGDISNNMSGRRTTSTNVDVGELATESLENERKKSIAQKLDSSHTYVQFTETEECDIQRRANSFIDSLKPDSLYCISPTSSYDKTNMPVSIYPCYVINKNSYLLFSNEPSNRLPIGTRLYKPPRKLVELVALALNESPDKILQVQQVYSYIMLKFPYFAFMDKLSMNSWRSSVRHALYQKWFRKISVSDEKIGSRGCFWAINRENTPREWRLPPHGELTDLDGELDHSLSLASYNSPSFSYVNGPLNSHYQKYTSNMPPLAVPGNGPFLCNPPSHRPIWQPSGNQYKMHGRPRRQLRPSYHGPQLPGCHPNTGYHSLWRPAALYERLAAHSARPPMLLPRPAEFSSSSPVGHWSPCSQ